MLVLLLLVDVVMKSRSDLWLLSSDTMKPVAKDFSFESLQALHH